ncbi:PAS domain S-box protein [Mucilaginibacter segetis]|uniref:histidine kinase n=1 Tax=Mucilaginibacter segetis TaxID=2793071 RepID=A0A934ULT3_9SPHI|nr:PAS domain S-box protein [Mucilaginibacter segetis]MBK0378923.1 PAS domain S-box protein [Mucilaginibacter segetis]
MRFSRNLRLGYGFSVGILILVGVFSYITLNNLLQSNRAVTHSNIIISELENTISVMKDAETGQRGYLLTDKRQFLQPYNGAYNKTLGLIKHLQALTKDNVQQQQQLNEIQNIVTQRMNILQALINKRKSGLTITSTDLEQSKAAMDTLRRAIAKAEDNERSLLRERLRVLNRYVMVAPYVIVFAVLLAILIAVLSYLRVIADIKEKDRLTNKLQLKEEETAAFNEELTAANEEIKASNEELISINEELISAQDELALLNDSLEQKIIERTQSLAKSEEETQALNEELTATNEELAAANEEMLATNEELEKSREEVRKSEHLFRSIAVNIPNSLIIVIDKEHRYLSVEGDMKAKMGYTEDNYAGKYAAALNTPQSYAASKPLFERVLNGEQFTQEQKNSTGGYFRIDYVPLRNEDGEVYAALIITLDITDIKKAEEHSAKLAAIVESSDDAIIGKTLDGVITSWNKAAERMYGYTVAEMIGESIMKLIPEERWDEEPGIISRLKSGERVEHFETKRIGKEKNEIDVSLTISPIRDAQGNIIGVSKIARDITEKKRDEQRKNDFIGMVSHELKTPLTSLSALIQVAYLKLRTGEDKFLKNAMEKASMQTKKMGTMINGFLNISRLESGKLQIEKQDFNIDELLKEVIAEQEMFVSTHTIKMELCDNAVVHADRDKIGSVVSNLLSNAVKYSPKGTSIFVNCRLLDNKVQISVKDEGMGIPADDAIRVFDRYFRAESQQTRHISGFGIGLYLSAEIIKIHDGDIWAESAPHEGSTFYFTLPL